MQRSSLQADPLDPIGAFCVENSCEKRGKPGGSLTGLSFAAKDLFDIEGVRTGFGNPDWLKTQMPAQKTAPAVQLLLDAGANLVAKSHCDELCYSLTGENVHYGTPENVNAPGRIPGGSSNGSAAAVAAGLVDFGLGSDCGGSIRIPASYCGLVGLRPTWGRIPLEGAAPFGPSFDVAGLLARDPKVFAQANRVLLQDFTPARRPTKMILIEDAFARLTADVASAFAEPVAQVADLIGAQAHVVASPEGLENWFEAFRTIQAYEVWASVGPFVLKVQPHLGPGIKERLDWARTVTSEMHAAATAKRNEVSARLADILEPGAVLCLPTSPRVAPLRNTPTNKIEIDYRNQAMCLLCISGLTGLPQLSLPLAHLGGLPLGLSFIAAHGRDVDLLDLAERALE